MGDKYIFDPLHGYIKITPLMQQILDTQEFQRLRYINQLGATYYVFPSGTHTRLEHSIGVSHLCGLVVETLRQHQPELKITNHIVELYRIAGMMHDIGHAPFSHVFDNEIIPQLGDDFMKDDADYDPEHEVRSCKILENMVSKYNLKLTVKDVNFIKRLIIPGEKDTNWQFQILANAANEIDVDKIDYIQRDCYHLNLGYAGNYTRILEQGRVIDEQLCYPEKLKFEIYSLFHTRYRLHKEVYNHPTSKAYEFLLSKLFISTLNESPGIKFIELTENLMFSRYRRSAESNELLTKIDQRKHPRMIAEYIDGDIKDITTTDNQEAHVYNIGFVGKNKEMPLNNVWYYKHWNQGVNTKYHIDVQNISPLISTVYQESGVRVYQKI